MVIVKQFLCQSYALNAWVVACGCSRVGGGDLESQDHHFVSKARRGLNVEHAHGLQGHNDGTVGRGPESGQTVTVND